MKVNLATLMGVIVLLSSAHTAVAQRIDLNGVWDCNDGGRYYL